MSDDSAISLPRSPVLPPAPRRMSSRIAWRCRFEPRARFWLFTGGLLTVLAAGLFFKGWMGWWHDGRLMQAGTPVDAQIVAVGDITLPGKALDPTNPVRLTFPWRGSLYATKQSRLLEGYGKFVQIGDVVRIRLDPADPEDWTYQSEAASLVHYILPALLTLPAAIATLLAWQWREQSLRRVWRDGTEMTAIVLRLSSSALAPTSHAIRCTPLDEGDSRLLVVYPPPGNRLTGDAETVRILALPGSSTVAAAVDWFK